MSNDFLFLQYDSNSVVYLLLYSMITGDYLNIKEIHNDIDGVNLGFTPCLLNNNTLVYKISPYEIIGDKSTNHAAPLKKTIDGLANLNENDNPVLAIVMLKKF